MGFGGMGLRRGCMGLGFKDRAMLWGLGTRIYVCDPWDSLEKILV